MAGFFSIDKKEEQSDISNIDNYELNLDADEIAKKASKTMFNRHKKENFQKEKKKKTMKKNLFH